MYTFRSLSIAALFFVTSTASGQMVIQADQAVLQPQIRRDANGFLSCGLRALVMSQTDAMVDTYDFSVNVDSGLLMGTLKAGKLTIPLKDMLSGRTDAKVAKPAPINFWIAVETEGVPVLPQKIVPSETDGFILAAADLASSYRVFLAMAAGERMQFAVRYKKQPLDVVIAFSAKLREEEANALMACSDGIIERMKKTILEKQN